MKLFSKVPIIFLLIFIFSGLNIPPAQASLTTSDLSSLFAQQGDGLFVCRDDGNVNTCTKVNEANSNTAVPGNVTLIVFNQPLEAAFRTQQDEANLIPTFRNDRISISYSEGGSPECTYGYMNRAESPTIIEVLPCSQGRHGISGIRWVNVS